MPKPKKNESKQDYLKRCTSDLIENEGKESDQAYAMCNAYWDEAKTGKAERAMLTLSAPLELKEEESETRTFLITAYTGQPIDTGWFGKIIFDLDGMKAKAKIPILREHKRDRVVGYSKKAWADQGNFLIAGAFAKSTRDSKEVLTLADEGFPWQASVGIWPKKIKRLESAEETATVNGQEVSGPIEIWTQSLVGETSFVALGADDETAAITLNQQDNKTVLVDIDQTNKKEAEIMPEITLELLEKDASELLLSIRDEAVNAGKIEGMTEERARVMELLTADADAETVRKAIQDGVSVEASYKLFYEAEKQKRATGLQELEKEATSPVGKEEPKTPETRPVDQVIAEKAAAVAKERSISIAAATAIVMKEEPELTKAWTPKLH